MGIVLANDAVALENESLYIPKGSPIEVIGVQLFTNDNDDMVVELTDDNCESGLENLVALAYGDNNFDVIIEDEPVKSHVKFRVKTTGVGVQAVVLPSDVTIEVESKEQTGCQSIW